MFGELQYFIEDVLSIVYLLPCRGGDVNVVKVDKGEGDGYALIHVAAERNIGINVCTVMHSVMLYARLYMIVIYDINLLTYLLLCFITKPCIFVMFYNETMYICLFLKWTWPSGCTRGMLMCTNSAQFTSELLLWLRQESKDTSLLSTAMANNPCRAWQFCMISRSYMSPLGLSRGHGDMVHRLLHMGAIDTINQQDAGRIS